MAGFSLHWLHLVLSWANIFSLFFVTNIAVLRLQPVQPIHGRFQGGVRGRENRHWTNPRTLVLVSCKPSSPVGLFVLLTLFSVMRITRSSAVAKRPRDASCLYSFYTLEWCSYPMVNKFEHMFIRFDMIHEREKIAVFMYRIPHFCFPWGRPWGNHAKCCMDGKRIRYLQIVPLHVPI